MQGIFYHIRSLDSVQDHGEPACRQAGTLAIHLLLCKIQKDTGKSYFDIDYDSLAERMGYMAPKDLGEYRNEHEYYYERIHRSLKRLKGYGLIDYRKGKVTLKANSITETSDPLITIPFEYWEYGYSDSLSMRAKYIYLICFI